MGFSRVQNNSNGTLAASVTVTLGATPTPGNLLIAWANSDATVTIGGSGWTAGPSVVDGNGAYMWWKVAGASEPSSVVFTPSVSDWITAGLLEYSGNTTSPLDVTGSFVHAGGFVSSTGPVSVTTTAAHDLGVAVAALHSATQAAPTSPVWTGGWTNLQSQGDGGNRTYTFVADNLDLGAAGTVSTGVSWSGTTWGDAQELLMTFKVTAITTDLFVNAQAVTAGSTTSTTTTGFTTETGEPLTCPVAATSWFTFTPAADGVYQIDTIGSGYDTGLSVYTGTTLTGLARVAYDDDSGGSSTSRLALEMIGGTQYYIQAGAGPSAGTTTGSLILNVKGQAEYNGWGSGTPAGTISTGSPAINAGTAFTTSLTGQSCTGVRVYVQSSASGDPTGAVAYLYAASGGYPTGSPLATAAFPTLTIGGWTEVRFSAPVALTANTVYYVVAYMKANIWIFIGGVFAADVPAPSGAPGLVFPADTSAHHNCAYVFAGPGTVPNATVGSNFLGVDAIIIGGGINAGWK